MQGLDFEAASGMAWVGTCTRCSARRVVLTLLTSTCADVTRCVGALLVSSNIARGWSRESVVTVVFCPRLVANTGRLEAADLLLEVPQVADDEVYVDVS